jgi:hypothetical protein
MWSIHGKEGGLEKVAAVGGFRVGYARKPVGVWEVSKTFVGFPSMWPFWIDRKGFRCVSDSPETVFRKPIKGFI